MSNDDGATWTLLENIPDSVTTTNSWTNVTFNLEDFVSLTSTMRIKVRAADGSAAGDLVETAIDDIVVTGYLPCSTPVGPGLGVFADGFELGDTSRWSLTVP